MKNPAGKLIMAGASLGLAVLLLVGTSMAWFSVSKSPEISNFNVGLYTSRTLALSTDGEDYSQILNLSSVFSNLAPLRPVSTIDGIHWFIPTYDELGNLRGPSEFICDSDLSYANASMLDENGDPLTGGAKLQAEASGYYSYADFWIRTEEDAAYVRLSVPSLLTTMEDWEKNAGVYGSYVLANYEQQTVDDGTGTTQTLAVMDQRAETCVRVGFLIFDDEDNTYFIIYEPNCDGRSSSNKPRESDEFHDTDKDLKYNNPEDYTYVLGYGFDPGKYMDGNYYFTRPIVAENGVGHIATDDELEDLMHRTMVQKRSGWSTDAVIQPFYAAHGYLDSNMVSTFGRFVDPVVLRDSAVTYPGVDYDGSGTAPDTIISSTDGVDGSSVSDLILCELTKDKPVKVRLFIWLEGQDVDCWNDIASGSFIVNLELAGETISVADPDDSEQNPEP